ncbi:MAG: hypothetical protein QXM12_06985 [Nitrososphaerota archaeon]
MQRWAIIDKETGEVLNVIVADEAFINQLKEKPQIVIDENTVKRPDEVEFVLSEIASVGDIVVDGKKIYRQVGEL